MKATITFLAFLFIFITTNGQDNFRVIKVNGTIVLKTKGVSLETGTVFSEKEDLLFRTDDAVAAVINPDKGRFVLTSKSHDLSSSRSNYMPSMYNISTRGGSLINLIDLQNLFSGKYVILGNQKIVIDRKNFPMDQNNFFFLRYIYKGESINKKLSFSGDTLLIDRNNLYTVDGNPIPSPDNTSISLFYRKGNESVQISKFDLIFPENSLLAAEIKVIIDEMKGKPAKDKIGEVSSYISEFYGKVSNDNLVSWLNKNFGLKP